MSIASHLNRGAVEQLVARWMTSQRWYPATGVPTAGADWSVETDGECAIVRLLWPMPTGRLLHTPLVLRPSAPGSNAIGVIDGVSIHDAPGDPVYARWVVDEFATGATWSWRITSWTPSVIATEQSNSSFVLGGDPGLIVKVFRMIGEGTNPEVEIGRSLTAAGTAGIARYAGRIGDAEHDLVVANEFIPDAVDGFTWLCAAATDGTSVTGQLTELGSRLAELHRALATEFGTGPAPDQASFTARLVDRAAGALADVPALAGLETAVTGFLSEGSDPLPACQRIHGDLHLGQVLLTPAGAWIFLDFEGEPLRDLGDRAEPDLPVRDVVGMLRSFDYADAVAAMSTRASSRSAWIEDCRAAFLRGYGSDLDPILVARLELDKALYETVYESQSRPQWLPIPVRAVHRLLEAGTNVPPTAPLIVED